MADRLINMRKRSTKPKLRVKEILVKMTFYFNHEPVLYIFPIIPGDSTKSKFWRLFNIIDYNLPQYVTKYLMALNASWSVVS